MMGGLGVGGTAFSVKETLLTPMPRHRPPCCHECVLQLPLVRGQKQSLKIFIKGQNYNETMPIYIKTYASRY